MNPFDLLNVPFGFLMRFLYQMFNNYALAIFFFAMVVKLILIPLGIQQQKSQIKMAKIKPKEQAIRSKYAGRTDAATNQKMQSEVLDMYKSENYSPMSGCLPLLIQLPILFALYGIIRAPLTYIAQFDASQGGLIDQIKKFIFENKDVYAETVKSLANVAKFENIQQIDIIKIFNNSGWLNEIKNAVNAIQEAIPGAQMIPAEFANLNLSFFGQSLTISPSESIASILLIIPVLNFAASFLQMRLQKMINSATMGDQAAGGGMKFMEYAMPLLIVWMSYSMSAALGLYWIFQSILGIAQMLILAKVYPLPKLTEADYEQARIQYGGKKKKKKKPVVIETEAEDIDDEDNNDDYGDKEDREYKDDSSNGSGLKDIKSLKAAEIKDEKYISKTIPKGINSNVKNNNKKNGKKYTFKRRKK